MKSTARKIKDCAILIGYDPEGNCVYSEVLDIHAYYDDGHVWDTEAGAKKIRLQRLKGYLFDDKGLLQKEFDNTFDLNTGECVAREARLADGSVQKSK